MELMMSGADGISAFPHNDDLFHWVGSISGAADTPYEGLEYQLSLKFAVNYPFEAPHVSFLTPCFHPNVDTLLSTPMPRRCGATKRTFGVRCSSCTSQSPLQPCDHVMSLYDGW
jgi:hypothetical protein